MLYNQPGGCWNGLHCTVPKGAVRAQEEEAALITSASECARGEVLLITPEPSLLCQSILSKLTGFKAPFNSCFECSNGAALFLAVSQGCFGSVDGQRWSHHPWKHSHPTQTKPLVLWVSGGLAGRLMGVGMRAGK